MCYAHVVTAITARGASLILNSSIFINERKRASLVPKTDSDTAQMQKIEAEARFCRFGPAHAEKKEENFYTREVRAEVFT